MAEEMMKNLLRWIRRRLFRKQTGRLPSRRLTGTVLQLGEITGLSLLELGGSRVLKAGNLDEAQWLLSRKEIPVVLFAQNTSLLEWRQAVRLLADASCSPSVLLVATSLRLPGWEEITAAGGYDVITEPVSAEPLARAIRAAYSHWRSRRALQSAREVSATK
jgi:DNA-binding NtrC family response regulator